jgi:hypothetical protein
MNWDELGRLAYEKFREYANANGKDSGIPGGYPHWDGLPEVCKEANRQAAMAVVKRIGDRLPSLIHRPDPDFRPAYMGSDGMGG